MNFLSIFKTCTRIEHIRTYEPNYNICAIFYILLNAHVIHFKINFDNHMKFI
jgi:hypothetical protein